MIRQGEVHIPVLLQETLKVLQIKPGENYIDATLGAAGHAVEIVKKKGRLLGIDADKKMLKIAKTRLRQACPDGFWRVCLGNYRNIDKLAIKYGFCPAQGIIFDLGLAAFHYRQANRGFSFHDPASLDMRLSGRGNTALDLITKSTTAEIAEKLTKIAQEKYADQIAYKIKNFWRQNKKITGEDLANIVTEVYRQNHFHSLAHPATKTFLAFRVWTNNEFENIKKGIEAAFSILKVSGILAVISFHSGEDRLVKQFLKRLISEKRGKASGRQPIRPGYREINANPLARSATLRFIEKC